MVLPLRIWGMESSGKPFSALAHTLDITRDGVRLGGVRNTLNAGDIIGIQYRHNKGRFRIVWVGDVSTPQATQLGLQVVEHGRDFWGLEGPEFHAEDEYIPQARPAAPAARSLGRMYPVEGTVEVRNQAGKMTYVAQVAQIGQRGAYIQAHTPYPVGAQIQVRINISNHEIATTAVVRASQPAKGMSVEFSQPASVDDAVRLKSLIYGLESGIVKFGAAAAPAVGASDASFGQRVSEIAEELRRMNENMAASLTAGVREEFSEAISHLRNTASIVAQCSVGTPDDITTVAVMNTLRIQSAIRLCNCIGAEMRRNGLKHNGDELRDLLHTVEDLFTLLAGLNFSVGSVGEEAAVEVVEIMETSAPVMPAAPLPVDTAVDLDDIAVAAHLAHFHEHRARKKRKS